MIGVIAGIWIKLLVAVSTNQIRISPTKIFPNKRSDSDNTLHNSQTSSINHISNQIATSHIFAKNVAMFVTLGTIHIQWMGKYFVIKWEPWTWNQYTTDHITHIIARRALKITSVDAGLKKLCHDGTTHTIISHNSHVTLSQNI